MQKAIDIMEEEFEAPATHSDLADIIEASCELYNDMPRSRKDTRDYRNKLNALIDDYNERRGTTIFIHVK